MQMAEKRLYRSRDNAYVGGVCAGLAEYFELDSIVVRILAILLAGLTLGVAGLVYIVLWARLPLESKSAAPYDVTPESAESSSFGCVDCLFADESQVGAIPLLARVAVAAGIMVLFLAVAINAAPFVPGTEWWQFWPVAPLMAGICLIIIPIRTPHEASWHALGIVLTALCASILPMSLGIMSWATALLAFERMWLVVLLAVGLFVVGAVRGNGALIIAGALLVVLFCLIGLSFCAIPGFVESVQLPVPAGRAMTVVIAR